MDRNHHGNGWAVFKGNGESGKKREDFKQEVYHLMCGQMVPEESVVPGAGNIRNEFAEGSFCGKEYEKIYEANRNLCERLGVEEDGDVETIINSFFGIANHLCLKMYDYGEMFSGKGKGDGEEGAGGDKM